MKPVVRRRRSDRGFTLLELIVATMIMGIAIVGLLEGIAGATRNAARLRDYDRVILLARQRMDEMLVDQRIPKNTMLNGGFDPMLVGGLEAGWSAQLTVAQMPPALVPGYLSMERLQLDVWWEAGRQRRTISLEGFRKHILTPQDIASAVPPQGSTQ